MEIINAINKDLNSDTISINNYELTLTTFIEIVRKNKIIINDSDSDSIDPNDFVNFPLNESENIASDESIHIEHFQIPAHIYELENDDE
jgi:hypothetical protein